MKNVYHCSYRHLGKRVTLRPQLPAGAGTTEQTMAPRVCFAPTIAQALMGKSGESDFKGVFGRLAGHTHFYDILTGELWNLSVYTPSTDIALVDAVAAHDFSHTKEKISYDPVPCHFIGYVCYKSIWAGRPELTSERHCLFGETLPEILGYE